MLLDRITPLILTFNELPNIARTTARLEWARRILVVDSFSTDGTVEFLRRNPRVELLQRRFDSFAGQCNFGLTHIQSEWVLSLDADYVCSEEIVREIASLPDSPTTAGFQASFKYCVNGRPLRGSLYPARTVLYRRKLAQYVRDGHAHRVVVNGEIGRLAGVIYHDDRKPLEGWLAAQTRYAANEVQKLRSTPKGQLSLVDRMRLTKWIAPLVMPAYCLFGKGLILNGWAGLEYTLQRTYAELLLSLRLFASESDVPVARNEHGNPVLDPEVGQETRPRRSC